jgi:nucleoside-diphosphate-sugar epimerase
MVTRETAQRQIFNDHGGVRATGSRSKIVFKPLPQDDPKQRKPDITRARKLLHWEPRVPLAQGLVKMNWWKVYLVWQMPDFS